MKPREKAFQICDDLCWIMGYGNLEKEVKDVALFTINEILESVCRNADINSIRDNAKAIYYEEIKKEIEKL